MQSFFHKFLAILQGHSPTGGLEISDLALRFMHFADGEWRGVTVKLPPGTIVDGKVIDRGQLVLALKELHKQVVGRGRRREKKKVSVVACLSSLGIYTQAFSLPVIEGENLEKAIELNLRMASPSEISQSYSGWQIIGEDKTRGRLEVLSAFVSRAVADEITEDLYTSGFLPVALESGALSITRLVQEKVVGFDREKSYVVLNLRSGGMDFLIVRKGRLHFEYFVSWHDVQANEKKIPLLVFQDAVMRNVRQVLNFYAQHWQEPISELLLMGGNLNDEIARVVKANFPLPPRVPELSIGGGVTGEWFPAIGVGLRTLVPRRRDQDINLLGPDAQNEFQSQHLLAFLRLWRVVIPVSLILFATSFFAGNWFLEQKQAALLLHAAGQGVQITPEAIKLQGKVKVFNHTVDTIGAIRSDFKPKYAVLQKIQTLLATQNITMTRFSFRGFGQPSRIDGEARSDEAVKNFKKALESDSKFQKVSLPLDAIRPGGVGSVFYIEFVITSE